MLARSWSTARGWALSVRPGVLDVFKGMAVPFPGDRDRIETIVQMRQTESSHPGARDVFDLAALLPRHCFEGMPVSRSRPRLDLDESDCVRPAGDNIDLLPIHAITALEYMPATGLQVVGSNAFGNGAAFVRFHWPNLRKRGGRQDSGMREECGVALSEKTKAASGVKQVASP